MKKILLVEDDVAFSNMLKHFLQRHKYVVDISYTIKSATTILKKKVYNLIFSDLRLPDGNGIDLLKLSKESNANIPVVLMTGYAEVSTAVQAMKQGAFDYISKPFNPNEVLEVINNALEVKTCFVETKKEDNKNINTSSDIISGISVASKNLFEHINLVAPTNMSILITGESGTGKEVAANRIHNQSLRKNKPFIAVDCGAIPKDIASSEFFGHLKGSFTGATNDKIGHFEAANEGTLFLDEVGNLNYESQVQLLRALQERKIKPVGSNKEINVNIRLITATNENLLFAVKKGNFREDLYHRLNEFSIKVPSLNERKDDLILYADFFLEKANEQLNKSIIGFSQKVLVLFQQYNWPGNLRELSNVIKRATLLSQINVIEKNVLPEELTNPNNYFNYTKKFSTKENEKTLIINTLKEVSNNKTKAAKLLNITRKTLYNKLNQYGIN